MCFLLLILSSHTITSLWSAARPHGQPNLLTQPPCHWLCDGVPVLDHGSYIKNCKMWGNLIKRTHSWWLKDDFRSSLTDFTVLQFNCFSLFFPHRAKFRLVCLFVHVCVILCICVCVCLRCDSLNMQTIYLLNPQMTSFNYVYKTH